MLLASLAGSNYEWIAEEMEKEKKSSAVWRRICNKQVSPTVAVDKTLEFWSKLLANKVSSYQEFDRFYSVFRTYVTKLKKENSTAVNDAAFMRSLLYSSINLGSDEDEVHALVTNDQTDWLDQLQTIKTKVALRQGSKTSLVTSRKVNVTKTKVSDQRRLEKAAKPSSSKKSESACFPPNVNNFLPPAIYDETRKLFNIFRF